MPVPGMRPSKIGFTLRARPDSVVVSKLMTFTRKVPSRSERIANAIGVGVVIWIIALPGCNRKPARLVMTEVIALGVNTETAEYDNGSTRITSQVAHWYNAPTGERSESGDFTAVFRAMTGKELPEPGTVRSAAALLAVLERERVKLTLQPQSDGNQSPMAPSVRVFTVGR
jgi:hypothetical protein